MFGRRFLPRERQDGRSHPARRETEARLLAVLQDPPGAACWTNQLVGGGCIGNLHLFVIPGQLCTGTHGNGTQQHGFRERPGVTEGTEWGWSSVAGVDPLTLLLGHGQRIRALGGQVGSGQGRGQFGERRGGITLQQNRFAEVRNQQCSHVPHVKQTTGGQLLLLPAGWLQRSRNSVFRGLLRLAGSFLGSLDPCLEYSGFGLLCSLGWVWAGGEAVSYPDV